MKSRLAHKQIGLHFAPLLGPLVAAALAVGLPGFTASVNVDWHPLGPVNMQSYEPSMGRVNFVAVNPSNSQALFVCSASGGLWASTDGGQNWQPRTDDLPVLGTSGVVIDPQHTNVMYLATGDADALDTPSIGVWKSTNGGVNWSATGLNWPASSYFRIYKLVMHPSDSTKLFAATSDGIYSSTNAGGSWLRQTPGSQTTWYDLAFQPGTPATLYAVSQQALFYRSINTGASWQAIGAGLPTSTSVDRSAIAVSAARPQGIYMICAKQPALYSGSIVRQTAEPPSCNALPAPIHTSARISAIKAITISPSRSPPRISTRFMWGGTTWLSLWTEARPGPTRGKAWSAGFVTWIFTLSSFLATRSTPAPMAACIGQAMGPRIGMT